MPANAGKRGFLSKSPYSLPAFAYGGGRKRIFIGLLCATCLSLCLLVSIFLIWPWLLDIPHWLPGLSVALGVGIILILGWLCLSLVLHLYTGRPLPGARIYRHALVRLFLPCMQIMGSIFGIDRSKVQNSFIKINNELLLASKKKFSPARILVLLPHCIQSSHCSRRLTYSSDSCLRCGKCPIGSILGLRDRYGFTLAIATGGTIARRIVVNCRPACIIAVACERDLSSGIQDSYPLPVFGILNQRPKGPCMDTLVDCCAVENAIHSIAVSPAKLPANGQ